MRIASRLRIVPAATVVALVILVPVLVGAFMEFRNAKNDYVLAEAIKVNFFERASFRDQYFLYREDRAWVQWEKSKEAADRLSRQADTQFHGGADRRALERLRQDVEDTAAIFHRIVNNTEKLNADADRRSVYGELDKRLFSQILLKDAAIRDATTVLQEASVRRVEQTYKSLTIIIGLFALTLAFATILTSVQLGRLIRRRLAPLHDGARTIADGNLDYRLDDEGSDEFAELALSINAMTDSLQASTQQLKSEIGAHEQLENLFRHERNFINAVLDTAGVLVIVINREGEIIRLNRAAEEFTGYTLDEVKNRPFFWDAFLLPEQRQGVRTVFEGIRHGKVTPYYENYWLSRDGKPRLFAWANTLLYDAEEQMEFLIAVGADISERKQMEEELRQINESLEQRVQEGIARNMGQERLLIQQSRLAAMGEMIGNIAHQWRQPINALSILLANLKDAYEYHELDREYLDREVLTGQNLIQKMSDTIDDFRNFFKPNKEKQSFFASDGVEEAVKLVRHSFTNSNIKIIQDNSAEACSAFGYPNEFAQVVLNALSNAKEAIIGRKIAGEVHIRVKKEGGVVTVAIRDNGGGIPEEILGKVFDPYFTTKEKGTGIGLYMSKMIMEHMDGAIAIRNVESGAEVLLTLPLAF